MKKKSDCNSKYGKCVTEISKFPMKSEVVLSFQGNGETHLQMLCKPFDD